MTTTNEVQNVREYRESDMPNDVLRDESGKKQIFARYLSVSVPLEEAMRIVLNMKDASMEEMMCVLIKNTCKINASVEMWSRSWNDKDHVLARIAQAKAPAQEKKSVKAYAKESDAEMFLRLVMQEKRTPADAQAQIESRNAPTITPESPAETLNALLQMLLKNGVTKVR